MAKLVITRGLPASGKTTYAKAWVAENPSNRVRVNRDDLRQMSGLPYSPGLEQRIIKQRDLLIDEFLSQGKDVINDDTNLPNRTVRDLRKIAKRTNAQFQVVDLTNVDIDECHARNFERMSRGERGVPVNVIEDMYKKYVKGKEYPLAVPVEPEAEELWVKYEPDLSKSTAYIFDIDGTCAHMCERSPYDYTKVSGDTPDPHVIFMAWQLKSLGHHIIFLSGRKDNCFHETFEWLKENTKIDGFGLMMRDSDDNRKDSIVKYELFDKHVRHNYNVLGVFDDRNQVVEMWRKIGLKCFQCAEGNF